jgi:hypothetical protein
MGHLDIDLDLDEDLDFNLLQPPPEPTLQIAPVAVTDLPSHTYTTTTNSSWTFNPTDTLFFPRPPGARRGRAKDPLEVAMEQGTTWRALGFFRTETEEQLSENWDGCKLELTREWKRRHREAVKSRRRRGGVDVE